MQLSRTQLVFGALLSLVLLVGAALPNLARAASVSLAVTATPTEVSAGGNVTLSISLSSDVAISAVSVVVAVPSGATVVSSDATGSIFPTELTSPTISGGNLTWERLRSDTGYTGSNGVVGSIVISLPTAGSYTFTPTQGTSKAIAYADSSNSLTAVTASQTVTVTGSASTPGLLSPTGNRGAATALGFMLLAALGFYGVRKRQHAK